MAEYVPQTAAETLRLIGAGAEPWQTIGQFVDDWRRLERSRRLTLIEQSPTNIAGEIGRWAALLAAAVELLCLQDGLAVPAWVGRAEYRLPTPWFLYPGWRLRAWQLVDTPAPFKARNIFGGDRILDRV